MRTPHSAQPRHSLQPMARVKGQVVILPCHISLAWYPNPAEPTLSLCPGAAQKAPLAVPCSAWCYQKLIDSSSKPWDMECPKPFQGQYCLPCLGGAGGLRRNMQRACRGWMGDCISLGPLRSLSLVMGVW